MKKIINIFLLDPIQFCFEIINFFRSFYLKFHLKKVGSKFLLRFPYNYIRGFKYISIGNNCHIRKNCFLAAIDEYEGENFNPEIIIGDNFSMHFNCQISAINKIIIGNNVLIGSRVHISDHSHGNITKEDLNTIPIKRHLFSKGTVIIGNNVWIGSGVAIMPNVTIGNNCIIGANSVVTKSFEANSVIAGCPAKLIKKL
jgi:acetyltransferase-like isoleucine patch superfamily enzyme